MTLDGLRTFCRSLPGTTEDIKWGHDLVFSIGAKMYAVTMTEPPFSLSFKTDPEEFALLTEREGIRPAPYLARHFWVHLEGLDGVMPSRELRERVLASYLLVREKLPARVAKTLPPAAKGRPR